MTASTSVYVRNAPTSSLRTTLAIITNRDRYARRSGSFLSEVSSSSDWFSDPAFKMTLRKATTTNPPTAAWIAVRRSRGAPGPLLASSSTQVAKMTGSTSRSSFASIGSWKRSWIESNGTSHSIAMNAASIHGSTRVVLGQFPSPVASARAPSLSPIGEIASAPPGPGSRADHEG